MLMLMIMIIMLMDTLFSIPILVILTFRLWRRRRWGRLGRLRRRLGSGGRLRPRSGSEYTPYDIKGNFYYLARNLKYWFYYLARNLK